jgi:hypothetical protein
MNLFLDNLLAGADPAGVAVYVAVMAFIIGSVSVARVRDEAIAAHRARRWGPWKARSL